MSKSTVQEGKESSQKSSITATMSNTEEANKDHGVLYMGIDLGTSRTSVAASNGVRVTVSSHVGYPKDVVSRKLLGKDILYGDEALNHRLSCRFYRPLAAGVLKLSNNKTDDVEGNMKAAADLIREIIRMAKPRKDELVYAVVGVPAQAAIHHKDAIIKAARESVDSVMLCSEPFSVAYGLDMLDDVLVIDIGAGTTDLCRMHGTMPEESDQITTTFAGDYVDTQLSAAIAKKYPQAQFTVQMIKEIKEKHSSIADNVAPILVDLPVNGKPTQFDVTEEVRKSCLSIVKPTDRDLRPRVPEPPEEPRAARRRREPDQGPGPRHRARDAQPPGRRQGLPDRGAGLRRRQRRAQDRARHARRVLGEAQVS